MTRRRGKIAVFLTFLLLISIIFLTIVEIRLKPLVLDFTTSRARAMATELVTAAASPLMDAGEPLVSVTRSADGIAGVSLDSRRIAEIRTNAVANIGELLNNSADQRIVVPIFSLTGSTLLSGIGIPVTVRILPVGDILADVRTDLVESGINQTMHTVELRVRVNLSLLVAHEIVQIAITSDIPLAETVIVGAVPDAYTAINRYEIDESEENDLNDYAASIP